MPAENGLPQYVSKHARTKLYQYYRRPPKGVAGSAFVRAFGSKDRKVVMAKYAAIHTEAEAYFDRLISGRTVEDRELDVMASRLLEPLLTSSRAIRSSADLEAFIVKHGDEQVRALTGSDRKRLVQTVQVLRRHSDKVKLAGLELATDAQRTFVAIQHGAEALPKSSALTLKEAYEQAWKPSKVRGKNTVVEVGRYVDEFVALNGLLPLAHYTREHWFEWRKDCLDRHGPGATAFKRFSMMKTICNEAIRAGLFERKHFAGQDVSMRKTKSKKLRNEGWLKEELTTWFEAPLFQGSKDTPRPDADYWIAVIIALTGARLSEVVGMQVPDVAERHGMQTFYLAREHGKTDDSRRILPIPKQVIDLGWFDYLATRPKNGPLFDRVTPKLMSQTYSRLRIDLDLTRKGCDIHAFRHHMKTLLSDLECPDRVSDYITGHAPPNVGRTYGKVLYETCRSYLDRIDLGVTIPKWSSGQ